MGEVAGGDPLAELPEVPVGSASEILYTCLQRLARDGIRNGLDEPGASNITLQGRGQVGNINKCQHKVERDLLARQGWPTENAWKALKSALLSIRSNGKCPEGERAERLRAIAEILGQDQSFPLKVISGIRDDGYWGRFLRELQADFPTPNPNPEQSATNARTRLVLDLNIFKTKHPNFGMRYGSKGAKEANDFTSLWIPRVFARVLLWLSALETCIKTQTGSCKKKTVQNAASRVLSRWYQWFDADGLENPVADRDPPTVAPLTLGTETEGAGGEKRGAPVSVYGFDGTVGTGQQAKQQRTEGVNVGGLAASAMLPALPWYGEMPVLPWTAGKSAYAGGLAASAMLPALPWHDGVPVLPGGAGSPDAQAEMPEIEDMLPDTSLR
jgi:hypothetical protein